MREVSSLIRSIQRIWDTYNRDRSNNFFIPGSLQPVSVAHVSETSGLVPYLPNGALFNSSLNAVPTIGNEVAIILPQDGLYFVYFSCSATLPAGGNIFLTYRWVNDGSQLYMDRVVFGLDVIPETSQSIYIMAHAGDRVMVRNTATFTGILVGTVYAVFCGLE